MGDTWSVNSHVDIWGVDMTTEAKLQKDMKAMQKIISQLAKEQQEREVGARRKYKACLAIIAALSITMCTAMICFTIYGITVFKTQEANSSSQITGLFELLSGAEKTDVHTGDNGVIITGDQNATEVNH